MNYRTLLTYHKLVRNTLGELHKAVALNQQAEAVHCGQLKEGHWMSFALLPLLPFGVHPDEGGPRRFQPSAGQHCHPQIARMLSCVLARD